MNPTWRNYFIGVLVAVCNHHAVAQTSEPCRLDYVVTQAISSTPILSWQDALTNGSEGAIKLTLTKNTYGPASIVIKANSTACDNITVSIKDAKLISDSSKIIDHSQITINYVKKWFQSGTAWTGISPAGQRKLVPELLLNDPTLIKVEIPQRRNYLKILRNGSAEYVDVSTDTKIAVNGSLIIPIEKFDVRDADVLQPVSLTEDPQQVWLKIATKSDTTAGVYLGAITLQQASKQLLTIPLEITVLPITLPQSKLEYSIYYRGQLTSDGKGSISSEYKSLAQYQAELSDIKKHGVANPTVYHEFDNPSLLKKALEVRKESGFDDKKIYYTGLSPSSAKDSAGASLLTKKIEQLKNIMSPQGYTDIYLYGIDEAKDDTQRRQLSSWEITHAAGAKVFAAGGVGSYANVGKVLDTLILAYKPDQEEVKLFHGAGKRILTYAFPQTGPEDPELFRRNYGVKLWAAGVDGAMPYSYMHSFGSSWNDFDHAEYRDHHFAYPTSNGVIDTIAWEGFHEAIEDARYLTAVEKSIEYILNTGCKNHECETSVTSARSFLEQLRAGEHQNDLYKMRATLSGHLTRLSDAQAAPTAPTKMRISEGIPHP